jgi:SAM-dependent methyltransferase
MKQIANSYANLDFHRRVAELIRNHSENREDIRVVAGKRLDWGNIRTLLDLGCGYGWFEKTLRGRFAYILGIDCFTENETMFLEAARLIAEQAAFMHARLVSRIDAPPGSFDLVVAAYSLYFFPGIVEDVKRVLRPEGALLVITHSESMLEEGERFFNFRNLRKIIRRFSAENGEASLRKHFDKVESVDYHNALVFKEGSDEDLASYIAFKREFISMDADPGTVSDRMREELKTRGLVRLNKNDRIFVARK